MAVRSDVVKSGVVVPGGAKVPGIRSDLSPYERVKITRLDRAPRKQTCGTCGCRARRHDVYAHEFFDLDLECTHLVVVKVGIYVCRCGACFTSALCEVPPRGGYAYRVRQKAMECLVNDTMTLPQTRERLWRDYHLLVSISTLHGWYVASGLAMDMACYEAWARDNFSGVLCVDEVYDTGCCVLVASDPLNDMPIAYWIAERSDRCTEADVQGLFAELKRILAQDPEVVITDGSPLYGGLVGTTWPTAHHQLCYFHVIKDICAQVLKGLREERESVPAEATSIRDVLAACYGRAAKRAGVDVEGLPSDRALLAQRRYLLVKQEGKFSRADRLLLKGMMEMYPALSDYREFMLRVYRIFKRGVTEAQARRRRRQLLDHVIYELYPRLVEAMKKLRDEVFEKLVGYLKYWNVPRTNNHVEGINRQFRKLQKICYKRRLKDTVRATLNHLFIYKARKHPLYDASYGPAIVLPVRSEL